MCRHLLIIAGSFLCITLAASAQTPLPDAIVTARSLVATMKLGEQYKMLLPAILLRIKPVVTQERAELESDYDVITSKAGDLYTPYYNEMLEQAATVYAANFTVDEMRQMEAFFRQPAGQKLIEKWPAIAQQTAQIGQDVSRKAAEELRLRLTDALRQKGRKCRLIEGKKNHLAFRAGGLRFDPIVRASVSLRLRGRRRILGRRRA